MDIGTDTDFMHKKLSDMILAYFEVSTPHSLEEGIIPPPDVHLV